MDLSVMTLTIKHTKMYIVIVFFILYLDGAELCVGISFPTKFVN